MANGIRRAFWNFPVPVHFGNGCIKDLPSIVAAQHVCRPLLVTDNGLAQTSLVQDMINRINGAGMDICLFSDVKANPTDCNVLDGLAAFKDHKADAVIALGGGSGLDAGKLIAMLAYTGSDSNIQLQDFDWTLPVPLVDSLPPVFTVPTTSGTGAEMDSASMYTDTNAGIKRCARHPAMRMTVVADPLLTVSLPAQLTAWTGMDALTHALEALFVDSFHPMCDGMALEALRLIQISLPKAYAVGTDEEARANMLAASSLAAVAFQKGLGATHGLSEPLGAVFDVQHGVANAILLPHILNHNRSKIAYKCELVQRYLHLEGDEGFNAVHEWVQKLSLELNIPKSLRDVGVPEMDNEMLGAIAKKAASNPTGFTNPIPMNANDYENILQMAMI